MRGAVRHPPVSLTFTFTPIYKISKQGDVACTGGERGRIAGLRRARYYAYIYVRAYNTMIQGASIDATLTGCGSKDVMVRCG